jgi:transcriptional regulator with XRE-family HTH domain
MEITPARLQFLKALMKGKGWTASDLATASHLARSTIWRILNGKQQMIDPPTVKALCSALSITEKELLGEPVTAHCVKEMSGTYSVREDPLVAFIRTDVYMHPTHRSAYEAVATAFGYNGKGQR